MRSPQSLGAYTTSTNRWSGTGVGYDGRGNQTALPARSYTYDGENLVVTASDTMGTSASYVYDGDGHRVKKTVGTEVTKYVYDAFGRVAAEYKSTAASSPCATCYLTADHLNPKPETRDSTLKHSFVRTSGLVGGNWWDNVPRRRGVLEASVGEETLGERIREASRRRRVLGSDEFVGESE